MQCIVTGCAFIAPDGRWVAGDLFTSDGEDTLVFNGNWSVNKREIDWQLGEPIYTKTFTAHSWWEKRGVFVFDMDVDMNKAMLAYLDEEYRAEP